MSLRVPNRRSSAVHRKLAVWGVVLLFFSGTYLVLWALWPRIEYGRTLNPRDWGAFPHFVVGLLFLSLAFTFLLLLLRRRVKY
jgi:hypothetical protein